MTHPHDVDAPTARAPEPVSPRATESELIERMARAAYEQRNKIYFDLRLPSWENQQERVREHWRTIQRAAFAEQGRGE